MISKPFVHRSSRKWHSAKSDFFTLACLEESKHVLMHCVMGNKEMTGDKSMSEMCFFLLLLLQKQKIHKSSACYLWLYCINFTEEFGVICGAAVFRSASQKRSTVKIFSWWCCKEQDASCMGAFSETLLTSCALISTFAITWWVALMHSYTGDKEGRHLDTSQRQSCIEERFLYGRMEAGLCGAEAAIWLVSTLKRSKNGKCLQRGGRLLYGPIWAGRVCFQSDPDETYLLSLSSSNETGGPRTVGSHLKRGDRGSAVASSALFNPRRGVRFAAVQRNDIQVPPSPWKNVDFHSIFTHMSRTCDIFKCPPGTRYANWRRCYL